MPSPASAVPRQRGWIRRFCTSWEQSREHVILGVLRQPQHRLFAAKGASFGFVVRLRMASRVGKWLGVSL